MAIIPIGNKRERTEIMERIQISRQRLLMAMTMMEAAALDLLDTIAVEREGLREDAEAEALAEAERGSV